MALERIVQYIYISMRKRTYARIMCTHIIRTSPAREEWCAGTAYEWWAGRENKLRVKKNHFA